MIGGIRHGQQSHGIEHLGCLDDDEPGEYHWRDAQGCLFLPRLMATRHLWLTIRMIWNHSVDEEDRLHPYKDQGDWMGKRNYPPMYVARTLLELSKELRTRNDLEPQWIKELQMMQR